MPKKIGKGGRNRQATQRAAGLGMTLSLVLREGEGIVECKAVSVFQIEGNEYIMFFPCEYDRMGDLELECQWDLIYRLSYDGNGNLQLNFIQDAKERFRAGIEAEGALLEILENTVIPIGEPDSAEKYEFIRSFIVNGTKYISTIAEGNKYGMEVIIKVVKDEAGGAAVLKVEDAEEWIAVVRARQGILTH
ncbi:hypothetical protein [Lutispora sp.]|uniref:hypothetical protein n=1 Tax=Lutispora sp. TaxID=2828727 RepID=UPI003565EE2E